MYIRTSGKTFRIDLDVRENGVIANVNVTCIGITGTTLDAILRSNPDVIYLDRGPYSTIPLSDVTLVQEFANQGKSLLIRNGQVCTHIDYFTDYM